MDEANVRPETRQEEADRRGGTSRAVLVGARVLSSVFRPNYYLSVVFLVLLNFTFLRFLPLSLRVYVVAMVYLITYALPFLVSRLWRQWRGLTKHELGQRRMRLVPYAIHLLCYGGCLILVWRLRLPSFVTCSVVIALCLLCISTVITLWWKISLHSAAVGATLGGLVAYASLFSFNPVWWLCLGLIVSGLVNSSRMLLRQHTLWQVTGGTLVGFGCGLLGMALM